MGMHKETPQVMKAQKHSKVCQCIGGSGVMYNGAIAMDLIPCENKEAGGQLSSLNWKPSIGKS